MQTKENKSLDDQEAFPTLGEAAEAAQAPASQYMNQQKEDGELHTNVKLDVFEEFDAMNLKEDLLRGIFAYGFEKPSKIQQRAIIPLSQGHDIIGQAQSGTGKTGAFSIGTLQGLDEKIRSPQILIVEPTRELATQVFNVYSQIGAYLNIKVHCCIGGTRRKDDESILRDGVHAVVGTPGRIYDMLCRRLIDTTHMKTLVLDEADEMLSRGFLEDIKNIFHCLPENIQVGLFSATMPPECLDITKNFMRNPIMITVKREELTLDGILQYYVDVGHPDYKVDVICDLYEALNVSQSVIFCSTTRRVDRLAEEMKERDFTVTALHGHMTQQERKDIMNDFRNGSARFLITTDLVARGIDVQGVSVVVNFDLPNDRENYIHRIGRAGRFGRKGLAINLITERDARDLDDLQKYYNTQIEPLPQNFSELF